GDEERELHGRPHHRPPNRTITSSLWEGPDNPLGGRGPCERSRNGGGSPPQNFHSRTFPRGRALCEPISAACKPATRTHTSTPASSKAYASNSSGSLSATSER